jgi:RNA polymerase sigma factor (sigma-70 family)
MDSIGNLISRLRAGDPAATNELVQDYGELLRTVIRKHLNPALRNQVDSADFMQETWLALLQNVTVKPNFETPQQIRAYLASVARNKVVDVVRRGTKSEGYNVKREVRINAQAPDAGPTPAHCDTPSKSAIRRELKDVLLDGLAPAYRSIGLRIFDGLEPADIAQEIGVSQRTVERVRKRLVELLRSHHVDDNNRPAWSWD